MNPDEENKKAYETDESITHYGIEYITPSEQKLIEEYFKGKILDLGCGCGRTTKYLADKKYNVIGVEIVKGMVDLAKKRYSKIKFIVGDACKLDFPDKTFDVVFFSYNGMDYIFPEEKRILAIKEISRVLKNGGIFVYSSHNPRALLKQFRPKFILRNIFKGTIFSKYKYEKQDFGNLCTYYASPKKQKILVEKNSPMTLLKMHVDKKDKLHPHYVFIKMEKN
ncbi:MAG: class I SAM-dependent methyltransferase [Candidatus Nanoarchaeia archaeon]|nr:class I SAM-dependent methyltransferase [Candidatus Nanoarchaeia archaeon]MDD5587596.1 class I SAM-dependent methyltransferase [Candidatus Nanoarchaeia archaeon]